MKKNLCWLFAALLTLAFLAGPAAAQAPDEEVIFELDSSTLERAFANPDPITKAPDLACTPAHWLWPNFCKRSHITKIWGPLAPCSIIWIDRKPYHIIRVFRIFRWKLLIVRPLFSSGDSPDPTGQVWEEIGTGRQMVVVGWSDNDGDGDISAGDEVKFDDGTSEIIESTGTGFSANSQDVTTP